MTADRRTGRVLILSNPTSGSAFRQDEVRRLADCIRSQGFPCEIVDIASLPAAAIDAGGDLRAVVAAGGDGTVAAAVNCLPPQVPVTVYPLGTENLLANYFGLSRDPEAMARLLVDGTLVHLDAGRANGRIFLLMASCGFDADVVHRLHDLRSGRHISRWTWIGPIWTSIRRYRYPRLRLTFDDRALESREVGWAFAVNFPVYAVGLRIAPGANPGDGLLDVCTFRQGSLWHALRYAGSVALGLHSRSADFEITRAARVRIESDEPTPYQLDGDKGGWLPLEIEALRARLALIVPRARALELGLQPIAPIL